MTPLQVKVITGLRKLVGKHNRFNVRLEEIAAHVGADVSAENVRLALIELRDDGFFLGPTECDGTWFSGRLPS
jgi:hypothetical protein